jgi:PAS domain S-box-containing protein
MSSPASGRILIVDDEVELKSALCSMLSMMGFETAGFTSGREALEALKEQDFDVLLTDLMMPEMDGMSLLSAAMEMDPHLVGVVMTGQATVQTAVEAMKLGAFDYVMKPFGMDALLPVLSRAIQARRLRMENLQLRETVAIYELSQTIAFTLDTGAILHKAADAALQQCHADEVTILLPAEGGEELYVAVTRDEQHRHILGERVPIEQGIAGWVARNREPLTLGGKIDDERFGPHIPRDDITSSVVMPLLVGSKLAGVFSVNAVGPRRPFTLGQVKALSILANIAGSALENARLHGEVLEAEKRYRGIFENSVEGIIRNSPFGQIITANPAAARILGCVSAEELMGDQGAGMQLHGELIHLLEGQEFIQGSEIQFERRDGSIILVLASARAVRDSGGAMLYYEAILEDITGRRRLEEQLRQSQKMDAVGRLAGGIAHDFNNLLTAIIGYSQIALARLDASDELRKDIEEVERAGKRAAGLTSQLLAFSRRQVVQPRVIDLNAAMAEMERMLRRLIGEDIELATVPEPALGSVKADPGQIEQIVMNLAVNARDAMPTGGKLTMWTKNVEMNGQYGGCDITPGPYVLLAVGDTGVGMDKETLSHLFEPFFTTKPQGQGTGLGLATVYGIVKQSGGHIDVDSAPGSGTTFNVYLPRVDDQSEAVQGYVAGPARGSETVLVVEDEESVRRLACKVLTSYGYKVLEAAGGPEALVLCEQCTGSIDIILTDVVMPRMNGFELADRIRLRYRDVKVLYMSGYVDSTITRQGVLDPSMPFIQKPFTPAALAQRMREALGK